jgi:hypothetical protein
MSWNTRRGLPLLLLAAGLGLLGDLILRAMPLGLNVGLWVAALVGVGVLGASIYLTRRQRVEEPTESAALFGRVAGSPCPQSSSPPAVAWRASGYWPS